MISEENRLNLSIIIVTKNCEKMLKQSLLSIDKQNYPKDKIEILVVDGGSVDNTKKIAKEFNAKIIDGGYPDNSEARRHIGVLHAANDIIVFIDSDNILPYNNWLKDMVQPFVNDEEIVGAFTKWYGYEDKTSQIDQYYALIGGNDPIAYYLGKNDRVPYLNNYLPFGSRLEADHGSYEVVKFNVNQLPVIGCNGFLIRKSIISQLEYRDSNEYLHIDVNVDIINKLKKDRYAIVKNTIIHLTGDTLWKSIKKRIRYMNVHHVGLSNLRRYKVFDSSNPKDVFNLLKAIFFAITLIEPLLLALKGYIQTKNVRWFFHPIVLFITVQSYAISVIKKKLGLHN
ncbi:MAG: glycosyltransferase family 2 protein [Thiomargarita sp.]|nr:glycosyltransferase family 2 protein [Thiomargarita sp.]